MALIRPVVPTPRRLRTSLWYHPMMLKSLSVVAACGTTSYRKTARCTMMRMESIPCHHSFALKFEAAQGCIVRGAATLVLLQLGDQLSTLLLVVPSALHYCHSLQQLDGASLANDLTCYTGRHRYQSMGSRIQAHRLH